MEMEAKTRGRKKLPEGERKVLINCFVKQKWYESFLKEIRILEEKYNEKKEAPVERASI
jgi:hypothetical protein